MALIALLFVLLPSLIALTRSAINDLKKTTPARFVNTNESTIYLVQTKAENENTQKITDLNSLAELSNFFLNLNNCLLTNQELAMGFYVLRLDILNKYLNFVSS